MATHDAERHHRLVALGDHPGDDGVHGSLVGRDAIGMAGFDDKALAPVVQHDARIRFQLHAAEVVEQGVDETAGVAILVDDGNIDRAFVRRH